MLMAGLHQPKMPDERDSSPTASPMLRSRSTSQVSATRYSLGHTQCEPPRSMPPIATGESSQSVAGLPTESIFSPALVQTRATMSPRDSWSRSTSHRGSSNLRPLRSMSETPFSAPVCGAVAVPSSSAAASYMESVTPTDAAVLSCAGAGKLPCMSLRVRSTGAPSAPESAWLSKYSSRSGNRATMSAPVASSVW